MSVLLEARNLSFRYSGEPLLTGIDFSLENGDFAALIGPNGAGKSTLLKLLLRELTASGGDIFLFGRSVSQFSDWPRLGYVPQANPASNPNFPATAGELVCMSLYAQIGAFRLIKKSHREKAMEALSLVGMQGCADRLISELSGGQLQRVMIARVLAAGCELLLLDEPASGIDAEAAEKLYELLSELNKKGMTILMVTHDTGRAAKYINRALCLEEGTMVELDEKQMHDELRHKHKHPK